MNGFCPGLAQDARRLWVRVCSHGSQGRRSSDITTRRDPGPGQLSGPGAAEECIFTPGQINTLSLIKRPIGLWTSLNLKTIFQPHYTFSLTNFKNF